MKHSVAILLYLSFVGAFGLAGPYPPAVGQPGSIAICMPHDPNDNSTFVSWAKGITVERGYIRIDAPQVGYVTHGSPQDALGPPQGQSIEGVVSLGDAGKAILTFDKPICNGPGFDFAVFENGFLVSAPDRFFLELAFVEVSSDGLHYERIPCVSLTQTQTQIPNLGSINVTDIHNFAGKYPMGYGTPFDLDDVRDVNELVDVTAITHVRLVDVVGCLQEPYTRYDCMGNKINEPWRTDFSTGGFDLDAVGVIHQKMLIADVNGDGIVDLVDYAIFSAAYLRSADSTWNRKCDFVPDDLINEQDLHIFLEQWLLRERWYGE